MCDSKITGVSTAAHILACACIYNKLYTCFAKHLRDYREVAEQAIQAVRVDCDFVNTYNAYRGNSTKRGEGERGAPSRKGQGAPSETCQLLSPFPLVYSRKREN